MRDSHPLDLGVPFFMVTWCTVRYGTVWVIFNLPCDAGNAAGVQLCQHDDLLDVLV